MNVILPQNLQRLYHCCQVIYSKAKKEKIYNYIPQID